MQRLTSLDAWLARLERLHPSTIDLGLDRVRRVKDALGLVPDFPLIVVGGTNGKGSTSAYLAAILDAAGYKTGLYTSPHLLRYNERVRVAGREAGDAELIAAFERVDAARDDVSLTYFEFGTLGAMARFIDAGIDVAVLEVGLGGRLDAVNVFDAGVAVVTSVDLDHMDYLGDSREKSASRRREFIEPVVLPFASTPRRLSACLNMPAVLAPTCGAWTGIFRAARGRPLDLSQPRYRMDRLPLPAMAGACQLRNASGALAALEAIQDRLPVDVAAIRRGLAATHVPGRFQYIAQAPAVILDVAHNPEAARALAATLRSQPVGGRTLAVVGMLADKDAAGVFAALRDEIDAWWTCTPASSRARDARALAAVLRGQMGEAPIHVQPDVVRALAEARSAAREDDRILIFGSFYTVAAVLDHAATQQ